MATGWAYEGAVLDQIEDTIADGVLTPARACRLAGALSTAWHAATISPRPAARPCPAPDLRQLPVRPRQRLVGINRRGSKDS